MADNDTLSLRDLLEKPMSEFPDLPDLPAKKSFFGKLRAMSAGHTRTQGLPLYHIEVQLIDPGKDVPQTWLDDLKKAGFTLGDYNVYRDFVLSPNAMKFFRRFSDSIGMDPNKSTRENYKLDENYNPTTETQDVIRGKDVLCITQDAGDNGRVYFNLDSIMGVKKPS